MKVTYYHLKLWSKKIDVTDDSRFGYEKDCDHIVETIDDVDVDKSF